MPAVFHDVWSGQAEATPALLRPAEQEGEQQPLQWCTQEQDQEEAAVHAQAMHGGELRRGPAPWWCSQGWRAEAVCAGAPGERVLCPHEHLGTPGVHLLGQRREQQLL